MLHKVFEFADKDAADVMVPRPDVVALPLDMPVPELLRLMLRASLHPLSGLRGRAGRRGRRAARARPVRRPARPRHRGGERARAAAARRSWCPRRSGWTSCWPSSGPPPTTWRSWSTSTARWRGWSTLEDLLEEIVGEIGDEFDLPDAGVRRLGKSRVRLGGSFPIEDFNDRFGTHLPESDYHSVGGYVFGELGRAPKVGDTRRHRRRPLRGQRRGRPPHRRGGRHAEAAAHAVGEQRSRAGSRSSS